MGKARKRQGWRLFDTKGKKVRLPSKRKHFNGQGWMLIAIERPEYPSSVGRVRARRGDLERSFFPSDFGLVLMEG